MTDDEALRRRREAAEAFGAAILRLSDARSAVTAAGARATQEVLRTSGGQGAREAVAMDIVEPVYEENARALRSEMSKVLAAVAFLSQDLDEQATRGNDFGIKTLDEANEALESWRRTKTAAVGAAEAETDFKRSHDGMAYLGSRSANAVEGLRTATDGLLSAFDEAGLLADAYVRHLEELVRRLRP
jgi:hypothetical protein